MEPHELTTKLAQLHAELSQTDHVDPESLELLRRLTDDIGRLLNKKEDVSSEDAEGVTSGLRDLVLRYESEHPELAITLGKVADALAAIGI
jgi:Domain of unknown function (DUF4404)